jgi:hypothetical protein
VVQVKILDCERRLKAIKAEPNHHVNNERTGTGRDSEDSEPS